MRTFAIYGLTLGALLIAAALFIVRRIRRKVDGDIPQSIVMLLAQPRHLTAKDIQHHLERIYGRNFSLLQSSEPATPANTPGVTGDDGNSEWILGASPHFVATIASPERVVLVVHNLPQPYAEDLEAFVQHTPELRFQKAARDHRAWLSVDVIGQKPAPLASYRATAALAAELIGEDCLALVHPPTGAFSFYEGEETKAKLRSEDPIAALFERACFAPVVSIDDDPRMIAAEAEAKRRLPEFLNAFHSQSGIDSDASFSVKANVTAGDRNEHIWIGVDHIENGHLTGRLANDPVNLPGYSLDSPVQIPLQDIEDWHYTANGESIGLFTVSVLQEIFQEQRQN